MAINAPKGLRFTIKKQYIGVPGKDIHWSEEYAVFRLEGSCEVPIETFLESFNQRENAERFAMFVDE